MSGPIAHWVTGRRASLDLTNRRSSPTLQALPRDSVLNGVHGWSIKHWQQRWSAIIRLLRDCIGTSSLGPDRKFLTTPSIIPLTGAAGWTGGQAQSAIWLHICSIILIGPW